MKGNNLISVVAQEEVVWFYRMKEMKQKLGWGMFFPALFFLFIVHHSFVFMHLLAETFLFFFSRKTFKKNLSKMRDKVQMNLNFYKKLENSNYQYGT